jgi:hypothetical protein
MAGIPVFPQVIFITVEKDQDDDYMLSHLTASDALGQNKSRVVGVYKFVEATQVVEQAPVFKKRRNRNTA